MVNKMQKKMTYWLFVVVAVHFVAMFVLLLSNCIVVNIKYEIILN